MACMVSLRPRYKFKVPVEAKCISPDGFADMNPDEIGKLPVWEGNRQRTLSELFEIEGETPDKAENLIVHVHGDVHKVRRVGADMSTGEIIVYRDAGIHLGEGMKGGKISVGGDAGSWVGGMMRGGVIEVKGNAGDYVGAAYRGSVKGMRGGAITIHGNAGNELGCFMRKGLIKVCGNTAQFAGIHMKDGAILIVGDSASRAGAEMTGGKIVVRGRMDEILPTFTIDSVKAKVKVNGDDVAGPFYVFVGDTAEDGEGKLYVAQSRNPHLKFYEQYL